MHAELALLIHLQQLETAAESARRLVADEPQRNQELDDKLAAAQKALDDDRQQLAANQAARRDIEKELSLHQGRLSKYKDQLMTVKTNREYQAMQKEIETAQHEILVFEERMLERMIEFDDVAAAVKDAELKFAELKKSINDERAQLRQQAAAAAASLATLAAERAAIVPKVPAALLTTFDKLIKHRGSLAVVEVRDGRCAACQVRIRPQVANEIRRHEIVFQCESCQRILYAPGAGD
jgi:predicted  nucleic acid-binding Zn-ribbon protein